MKDTSSFFILSADSEGMVANFLQEGNYKSSMSSLKIILVWTEIRRCDTYLQMGRWTEKGKL